MGFQVDKHGAALHAVLGQVLDAERVGAWAGKSGPIRASLRIFVRRPDVDAGAIPVVEHRFGLPVAVCVEAAAHVRQAVPLRRILRIHQQHVVAHHIGEQGVFRCIGPAESLDPGAFAVAQRRVTLRGQASRIQRHAAWHVQRQ
ncbi:hypothetical protein D3C71_1531280 [compost metagenome]